MSRSQTLWHYKNSQAPFNRQCKWCNSNSNTSVNVYGTFIMVYTCTRDSSPGSFEQCRLISTWTPTLRPRPLTVATSLLVCCYCPLPPSHLLLLLSLKGDAHFVVSQMLEGWINLGIAALMFIHSEILSWDLVNTFRHVTTTSLWHAKHITIILDTNLALECINDEIDMHWVNTLNTLLHHMIAILILYTLLNMSIQFFHNLHLTSINQHAMLSRKLIATDYDFFLKTVQSYGRFLNHASKYTSYPSKKWPILKSSVSSAVSSPLQWNFAHSIPISLAMCLAV